MSPFWDFTLGTIHDALIMIRLVHKNEGGAVMNIRKSDLLRHFEGEQKKWINMKNEPQNMVRDSLIDNVIMVLGWVLMDIEDMGDIPCVSKA